MGGRPGAAPSDLSGACFVFAFLRCVARYSPVTTLGGIIVRRGPKKSEHLEMARDTLTKATMTQEFRRRGIAIMLALCVGAPLCSCSAPDDRAFTDSRVSFAAAEQARVTSPSGQLDAVLVSDPYGPAAGGGVNWNVYITTKGTPIHMKTAHEFFQADPLTGGQLVWKGNHLLEVHYDIADIHEFRNLWSLDEIKDAGSNGDHEYFVEIRLVPISPDFSLLTPYGSFRSQE
jgi:hypothetical protein